jgi:sugar phosphate isomerase/epimerase
VGDDRRPIIPPERVGTITYTQRDVPVRRGIAASRRLGLEATLGRLEDQGSPVPLPGGWQELVGFLAEAGFAQIELAGIDQHPDNPGGPAPDPAPGGVVTPASRAAYLGYARDLRGFLDAAGLRAVGNHGFVPATWPGGPGAGMTAADRTRFELECEFGAALGTPFIGTGADPTSAADRSLEAWNHGIERWEALNDLGRSNGVGLYSHNHAEAYDFLQDGPVVEVRVDRLTGAPLGAPQRVRGESGVRLMEHFLERSRPELCQVELDVYWLHVAAHRFRWRYDWDGNRVEDVLDPVALVRRFRDRFALYHAKDGARTAEPPGVGEGYEMVPFGAGEVPWHGVFDGLAASGGNPNYEQDNAVGGEEDPGRSLRSSRISAANMRGLVAPSPGWPRAPPATAGSAERGRWTTTATPGPRGGRRVAERAGLAPVGARRTRPSTMRPARGRLVGTGRTAVQPPATTRSL